MSPVFDEEKYRALLGNLEISEVRLSDIDESLRIDSSFYTGVLSKYTQKILNNSHTYLKNEIAKATKGVFDIKADQYCSAGIPFVRICNLKNMQIDLSEIIYIPEEINNIYNSSALSYGDIIISKTAIPAASVVTLPNCNTSQDTIAIQLKRDAAINSFFTVTYLNSRFGLALMENLFTGNIQKHFNLSDCKEKLPIPVFAEDLQNTIKVTVKNGIDCNVKANDVYENAEQLLLQELGLVNWQPDDKSVATKTFADFQNSGRFDAEYYQPKYDEYFAKIKKYPVGISKVSNHFKQNKDTIKFTLPEYNYIEIGDIDVGNGEATFSLLPTEDLPANAKYLVKRGDILISKVRPYRGAVSVIDFEPENLIASGAFTILRETGDVKKEVLVILLRTPIYRDWLLKWNVGSSYPVIKDEDVLSLTIPIIRHDIQEQIVAKVQESFALRKESKRLLDLAKHAVEVAIEQGEDAAMKLLEI